MQFSGAARVIGVVAGVLFGCALPVFGQVSDRFAVDIEGPVVWQSRNDVRIPNNDTATKFSLVDTVGNGPYGAFRVGADIDFNERHGLRFVFAPLQIEDSGAIAGDVSFAGETFTAGPVDAVYQFSSYRIAYRYRFFEGDRWRWKIGVTGFIRDARIALEQEGRSAEDTDIGFVPLLNLQGRATVSSRWHFLLDFEGLGATQGRAFDVAARMAYDITDDWQVAFGYRTIEGGADVDDVFNFAWLHFGVASARFSF